jgi:hypothetical protein
MLTERDYMKTTPRSKLQIIVLPEKSRFATYTPKDWTNSLIIILAVLVVGFVLSRILR